MEGRPPSFMPESAYLARRWGSASPFAQDVFAWSSKRTMRATAGFPRQST
jgi:hypothetical protein